MFTTSLVVLICVRSLFYTESYDPYDQLGGSYAIQPENLYPSLPPPDRDPNATYSRELVDDVLRLYIAPGDLKYNP